jgi:hypothetical protein
VTARYIIGDTRDVLATLDDNSVDLVFSSPPFLALRSYLPGDHPSKHREIGSEAAPAEFLDTLLEIVELCDRVLAPHGSLVFELGDTFAGSGGAGSDYNADGLRTGQQRFRQQRVTPDLRRSGEAAEYGRNDGVVPLSGGRGWPLDKSLCGIPTLFAWSLAYGRNLLRPERTTDPWRIRNLVAWCRPNPPVGALGDKFRPGTSYLTVATKARNRYFDLDAVRTEHKTDPKTFTGNGYSKGNPEGIPGNESMPGNPGGAPPLDWWEIPTQPYKGAHYATFPERLVELPVKSMCPERVCVTCGEPSRRITEAVHDVAEQTRRREAGIVGGKGICGDRADGGASTSFLTTQNATLGWSDCGHGDNWRRGVVLDPFCGSGTTLAVAEGHGRDSIGIDIDVRNADLALERVGMFLSVEQALAEDGAA